MFGAFTYKMIEIAGEGGLVARKLTPCLHLSKNGVNNETKTNETVQCLHFRSSAPTSPAPHLNWKGIFENLTKKFEVKRD